MGVSSGGVGFNVAMLSRQPVLRLSVVGVAVHFRLAAMGGFAPCEALWRRVAGVSEAWMASSTPCGDEAALFDVNRPISHVIPLWLFQDLNWRRWNCNDSGGY